MNPIPRGILWHHTFHVPPNATCPLIPARFRVSVALRLLFLSALLARPAVSQSDVAVDYIVVLDVSGSMAGLPAGSGNPDIFGQVQASLVGFLDQLDPGTTVFIAPFADGLREFRRFPVEGQAAEGKRYVEALSANGNSTHVYASLLEALSMYEGFRADQPNRRVGVVVVYTDGQDNGPGGRSMGDVIEEFGLARQPDDFLYYSTLGVELSPEDRAALDASEFAAYNPSPSGSVTPLRVVEPRYPLLDFSNLLTDPETSRELPFDVRSRGGLPSGTRLVPRASFPGIEQAGGAVEVRVDGGTIDPTAPAPAQLGLRLVNVDPASLEQGAYEGTIQFEPTEPGVLALPVRARFRYQPPRTVEVSGAVDELDLGSLDPFADGEASGSASVPLTFNAEALTRGGKYVVRVEPDPSRPLPARSFTLNGVRGQLARELEVDGGAPIEFGVDVDSTVAPGRYSGVLVVESGPELEAETTEIPWTVEVSAPPRTLIDWLTLTLLSLLGIALLTLMVGGLLTGLWPFWKRPTLRGQLVVVRGSGNVRDIPLYGERSVSVGSGTDHLPDAAGRLTIRAGFARKGITAHPEIRAVAEEGAVLRKQPGERQASPFGAEPVADQDQFEIAPYTLEYVAY